VLIDERYVESAAYYEAGYMVVPVAQEMPQRTKGVHIDSVGNGIVYYRFKKPDGLTDMATTSNGSEQLSVLKRVWIQFSSMADAAYEELARRILAAVVSFRMHIKSVDYALQQYVSDDEIHPSWVDLAERIDGFVNERLGASAEAVLKPSLTDRIQ